MSATFLKGVVWGLLITFITVVLALLLAEVLQSDDGASPLAIECYEDPVGQTRGDLEAVHGPGEEGFESYVADDEGDTVHEVRHENGVIIYYEVILEDPTPAYAERAKMATEAVGYDWTTMEVCA